MTAIADAQHHLSTCTLVPVWTVAVELADRDDGRVREAVVAAVGLSYGPYRAVAFETATGAQTFEPAEGSKLGAGHGAVAMPARILRFSVPRNPETLARAVEAIRYHHSYEEPVIVVSDAYASRADDGGARSNPNRWWNRGFAE